MDQGTLDSTAEHRHVHFTGDRLSRPVKNGVAGLHPDRLGGHAWCPDLLAEDFLLAGRVLGQYLEVFFLSHLHPSLVQKSLSGGVTYSLSAQAYPLLVCRLRGQAVSNGDTYEPPRHRSTCSYGLLVDASQSFGHETRFLNILHSGDGLCNYCSTSTDEKSLLFSVLVCVAIVQNCALRVRNL